ncbi:hypothetical protein ACFLY8_03480 [Halobacteriota archaeon]
MKEFNMVMIFVVTQMFFLVELYFLIDGVSDCLTIAGYFNK